MLATAELKLIFYFPLVGGNNQRLAKSFKILLQTIVNASGQDWDQRGKVGSGEKMGVASKDLTFHALRTRED